MVRITTRPFQSVFALLSIPMPNLLQQANGVDPLHLAKYANYIGKASGIITGGYSVSLPDIYIDENTSNSYGQCIQIS